jgi:uncharacterized membrane protein YkvI
MAKLQNFIFPLMIAALLFPAVSFAANTSSVINQSYTPPSYLSTVIGIVLIVIVLFVGFKFLKSIISTVVLLIVLFILASVAYSFLTTGALTLSGVSGLINSIINFLKDIVGVSHTASNIINSSSSTVSNLSNTAKG